MNQKAAPPYFLLSFIPAVGYWILETNFSLEIALMGGIALGVAEMALEKYFTGHVHTLSKLNVSLVVILGMISLIAKEGIWFKLQPTLTGLSVASFLIYKKTKGQSLMLEMLKDMKQTAPLPPDIYRLMEWHMCLFLMGFAVFMAYVAIYLPTAKWLFWKTGGFYIVFGAFMIVEMIFLRWYLGRIKK
ncbi:MAG TPA: septation protein IspZ [Bacteriovoracaceae bacterium]|nr:septation protein IspZ [Bacteriovoracaceae bacterium]